MVKCFLTFRLIWAAVRLIFLLLVFCFSYRTGKTRINIESQWRWDNIKNPELTGFFFIVYIFDLVKFSDQCNVMCNVESMEQKARRTKKEVFVLN